MNDTDAPRSSRLDSIDILRGLVIVLMALDHARDFFARPDIGVQLDLRQASPFLFFTRWVTHLCAPTFVLLAGTGAFLAGARGMSRGRLAWFLLTRGLWLILLEHTLIHFLWFFQWNPAWLFAQVIWAIGGSMVLIAGLVILPPTAILTLGIAIIAGHNVLDGPSTPNSGTGDAILNFLTRFDDIRYVPTEDGLLRRAGDWVMAKQGLPIESTWHFLNIYPILPWFGIFALGYGLGPVLQQPASIRRPASFAIGLTMVVWFVTLRWQNGYGDPNSWRIGDDMMKSVMNFLNCQKYPPSLDYVLMTIGPMLMLLAALPDTAPRLLRPLATFGRVPLFFYLVHLPALHLAAAVVSRITMGVWIFQYLPTPAGPHLGLGGVYLAWIVVTVLLYFPCRWYADVKRRHPGGWLSYL